MPRRPFRWRALSDVPGLECQRWVRPFTLCNVSDNLEPSAEPKAKTGSRLTEQCRGRVVLATLMGELARDEHAALVHGHVSQQCHLKFAEENRALCRLGKGEGSRAVEGGPQELWRYQTRCGGERRIGNPRGSNQIASVDWPGKDAEPIARMTVRAAHEAGREPMRPEPPKPTRRRLGFFVARRLRGLERYPRSSRLSDERIVVEQRNAYFRASHLQLRVERWGHAESHSSSAAVKELHEAPADIPPVS
jgi:hypothetical protein